MIDDVPLRGDGRKTDAGGVNAVRHQPDRMGAAESILQNQARLAVAEKVSHSRDVPSGRNSW